MSNNRIERFQNRVAELRHQIKVMHTHLDVLQGELQRTLKELRIAQRLERERQNDQRGGKDGTQK